MYLLLILIFGTAFGYDPRCPVQQEWSLRAHVSCFTEDKYVCLFNLLEKTYQSDCSGSSQSSKGSKLVFQPVFNLAECNHRRFQPIVFTTYGNSECILLKSNCNEEGQTAYSNGSSSTDIACGCDYSQGYSFVIKPKNSCFCIPSEEDCTCFKVKCKKLSADYQCITNEEMIANTKCHEVYPHISFNQHNRTEQTSNGSIKGYSNANTVTNIIIVLLAAYSGIVVLAVLIVNVREYKGRKFESVRNYEYKDRKLESVRDDEYKDGLPESIREGDFKEQQRIHKLILKGECGKHHFARIVLIGKNGVGKTSLMRRLLWKKKGEIHSTQSTDGIEVERCNINIRDGKWSPCDKEDNDLARLIQQVFTETKENENEASEQNIEQSSFGQRNSSFSSVDSKAVSNQAFVSQETITHDHRMEVSIQLSQDISDQIEVYESNMTEDSSDIDDTSVGEIKEENKNHINDKSMSNIKIKESNSNQEKVKTNLIEEFEDNQKRNEVENETGPENDENIVKMVSSVMESCLHLNADESHDKLALCALWDFAGQKDFYATHQVFLSKCAVFLLVTDSLESSYADQLWIDFKDTAQYVRFWFDAIHCYWSTTKENRLDPPIIVVCTNEDKIKNKKQHQSEFNMNLGKILNPQKKNEHLRNIYFVSNTEDDDTVFQEIRQEISNHAMNMNDWGRKCPLKWLLFQQVLVKMKDSNVPISTTMKLKIIAKHDSIGIANDEEFKKCLEYFHDIGSVIYFDEENVKDHVILDPKWLIDAFRCLVTDKVENIIQSSLDWQTLKENGELTPKLIDLLFKKVPKLNFVENKKHLLEVMKRFDIIVQLSNSSVLYMPCMMESCSFTVVKKKFMKESKLSNNTSWLCLVFQFLPPAFFNHILAWYIKQYDVSTIFDKRTRTKRNALYRQIGVFDLDSNDCEQLVVCEGPNIVALQVWNYSENSETYGEMANKLCEFINSIEKRYSLRVTYTKSFKCKDGNFTLNQKTVNDLLDKREYWCSEHNKNHRCDKILEPWNGLEEIN